MALLEWNVAFELTPAGADPGSVIDNRIQELKEQVRLRYQQGGQVMQVASPNDDRDGRHVVNAGGAGISPHIYKADQITKLVEYTDNWTKFNEPAYGIETTMIVPIPAASTGRVGGLIYHNAGPGILEIQEARMVCFTAPSGGSLTLDMHRLTNAYTDPNTTGATDEGSIWNTLPNITTTNFKGGPFTDFHGVLANPEQLGVGQAWVFELDAVNSAANVVLVLKVVRWPT